LAVDTRILALLVSTVNNKDACHPERSARHYPNLGAEKVVASQLAV